MAMSETITHSAITSPVATASIGAVVSVAALALGAVKLLGWCATSLAESTVQHRTHAGRQALDSLPSPLIARQDFLGAEKATLPSLRRTIPEAKAITTATLSALGLSGFAVSDHAGLSNAMDALVAARSVVDAREKRAELLRFVEAEHRQLVIRSLTGACGAASIAAGFPQLRMVEGFGETNQRVIALNGKGQCLISEIRVPPDRQPVIETEIVGVSDGSCHGTVGVFSTALQRAGVRTGAPSRKATGGVCELAAAREFLRERALARKRRTQRLNQAISGRAGR